MSALHWVVLFLVSAHIHRGECEEGGRTTMRAFVEVEERTVIPCGLCFMSFQSALFIDLYEGPGRRWVNWVNAAF